MFKNRTEAGVRLAARLRAYQGRAGALVLGLPRGGVVVAREVATALGLPLDVFLSRKLRAPGDREFGYGAVTELGNVRIEPALVEEAGASGIEQERELAFQRSEIELQKRRYRGARPLPPMKGRAILLVDDGIATGATLLAALDGLRTAGVKEIAVATPVGPLQTLIHLAGLVDACEALETPQRFRAVGSYYEEFDPVSNAEIVGLLSGEHPHRRPPAIAW
ncbi:MAG: phosphoribosyltransferase [Elusimicrobia bacterium]|nr:phosphoribosyltransferase [Elusimicrobiota bacterium]